MSNDESPTTTRTAVTSPAGISRRDLLRRGVLLGGFVGFGGLSAVLTGCSSSGTTGGGTGSSASPAAAAALKKGGSLKAALTGEPDNLDPATSTIYTGAQVYDNIFSKLVDYTPDGQLVGVLASKWQMQDDKTWVFDLVDNVTFHNGEKFTAADVKYTFERILDPKTASSYASLFDSIESVEATSPAQVTFHLKTPFGPFLANLANNGEIMNQKAVEAADPARNPVGTGPFQFVEWVQGDHISLKRFDGYFKTDQPLVDDVTFRFLNVDQSRVDGLRAGELDWVDAIPLQQLSSLKGDSAFTYVTSATAGIPDFLAMNTSKPPFDDKNLRLAVAWALDRGAIRDVAYFGAGEVGVEEVPSGSEWFDGAKPYDGAPDLTKAKDFLSKSKSPNGLTIEYLGLPQYPELLKTGEVVRDQLKKIGITMDIQQVDVSVWFDKFSKGDYQITSAYQERTIDPDNFYSLVLKSGGAVNTTFYSNKDLDNVIDQARAETDKTKRKALYTQIRQVVFDDAPLVFVHYETINYLMRKNVGGSTVNSSLELNFGQVGFTA